MKHRLDDRLDLFLSVLILGMGLFIGLLGGLVWLFISNHILIGGILTAVLFLGVPAGNLIYNVLPYELKRPSWFHFPKFKTVVETREICPICKETRIYR